MNKRGLLSHLADRFVTQREDLATEALLFILEKSERARDEVRQILIELGFSRSGRADFRSQIALEDAGRPDLVGIFDGHACVLFEAKFWAGLTPNQPVGYLNWLKENGGDALIFIAPEKRLELLWEELEKQVRDNFDQVRNYEGRWPGVRRIDCDDILLGAVTWPILLSRIERALSDDRDLELLESLGQLQVLCETEDTYAFLPLTAEELTSNYPRRMMQLCDLVDHVVRSLVNSGHADTKRLRAAGGRGWYGRYVHFYGAECLIHVSSRKWADHVSTPLWVRVQDLNGEQSPQLRNAFDRAHSKEKLQRHIIMDVIEVPIRLKLNTDYDRICENVIEQLKVVAEVLSGASLPPLRAKSVPPSPSVTESE